MHKYINKCTKVQYKDSLKHKYNQCIETSEVLKRSLLPFLPTTTGKVYLIKQSYCESSKIEAVFS